MKTAALTLIKALASVLPAGSHQYAKAAIHWLHLNEEGCYCMKWREGLESGSKSICTTWWPVRKSCYVPNIVINAQTIAHLLPL